MAATVGKYALKIADNAADWIKNLEFGKNASKVDELGETRVMVLDTEGLDRYMRYSKTGRGKLEEVRPGGLQSELYKNNNAPERYANFVEFAEQTDQPIHMPTIKIDPEEGMPYIEDGMVTYRALRDAGLKEIPVLVRKNDVREIMPSIISNEGSFGLSQSKIPVTKPSDYKPKQLTEAQQKVFDYEVKQQGRPAHTAKSIALGELDMSPAAKYQRRMDQGYTGTAYHGGSPDVTQVKELPEGFWTSKNPVVANTYTKTDTDFRPAMYEIAYNPSGMAKMDTQGYHWNKLEGVDFDITMPSGEVQSFADDLAYGQFVGGSMVEDTNDLARMADFMGLKGIEIDQINDLGYNFGAARRSFRDIVAKANPGADEFPLEKAWGDFLKDYNSKGATNVVITDPSVARSATGAAFDPRNRALPNIMGGGAALAVGLGASDSEAAVKQLDSIMGAPTRTPQQEAQAVISGKSLTPRGPTYADVTNKTIADNLQASPDLGSIKGIQPGYDNQLRGQAGFALQGFGKRAQDAGPLGFLAGSAIEDIGNRLQKGAYGESDWYDVPMVGLDILGLTPSAFMSTGMRSAMNNPDVKASIFKELFGN